MKQDLQEARRREIGHGALAERSLVPVLPSEDEFPYAIRVVSEVLLQTVQLLKAVSAVLHLLLWQQAFLLKPLLQVSLCGLITTEDGFTTMVDIQGLEDFYGEMDFKVAGTKRVSHQFRLI